MTSTFDDSVLDFDLNFLNQNSNGATVANTVDQIKYDKQKRNMSIIKKKIIATDSLIAKYYSKKQMLYEAEKNLAATKEECKQLCLDYRNALEKCSNLETERHTVQNAYKTVEERCGQLENQCNALQSHIHQLHQLIKEKDSTLEALRVENKKKNDVKEYEKKMYYLEKDKRSLNRDVNLLADLIKKILGKRKLKSRYNDLLRKYEVHNDRFYSDTSDVFEEPLSPPLTDINITKNSRIVVTDSECDNSIDTGRGSSISSDNEKLMLSPEYFINDCPATLVAIENRAKIKVTNVATSPIIFQKTVEEPSLPMIDDFEDEDESKNKSTNTSQLSMVDRCLSPIRINTSRSVGTSPRENATIEIQNEFESKDASTITDFQTSSLFESKDASTITDIQTPTPFQSKDASTITDIQTSTPFESKDASSITHIQTSSLFESKDASTITDIQTPTLFESKDASTVTDIQTSSLFESKDASTVTDIQTSSLFESKDASNVTDIQTSSLNTTDRPTSPINMTTSGSVFTSPMICITREIATSPVIINENVIQNENTQDNYEKECLELNNSNNLRCDKNTDFEIEMILNTMQMNHDIITPIPRTPSRVRNSEARNVPSRLSRILENDNEPSELEELKMELNNMKSILKQHILLTSKELSFNHEPLISKLVTNNDDINTIHCIDTNDNTLSESLLDGSEIRPESNLEISQSGLVPSPIDNDLLFGSSQSSTERGADHALDDNTTRASFPRLRDESILQNFVEEETTTEVNTETLEEISEDVNDFENQEDFEEVDEEPKAVKVKREKRKRLSKLDKIKKKLKPKYKIRSQTPPIVKLQLKAKQRSLFKKKTSKNVTKSILNDTSVSVNDTSISVNDTTVSLNDTSATLNDKHVYEKAVKIMAELNSKKSSKARKISSESVSKSVKLASSEEHANRNKTTQSLEKTRVSEVTSKSKKDALFEEHETPLDDNVTKVVPSQSQISSKEVIAQEKPPKEKPTKEKPTKEKLIRKKSWLPLSALFDDGDESSDSVMNSIEGCKSFTSSKLGKESLFKSVTSPSDIVNDNSKSGNQTKYCESPISFKANEESLSTSEISPLSILNDNRENTNQTNCCESTISSIPNEESLSTNEISPLSVLNVNSQNGNQTKLCESPISSIPTTETLFTSEISPSSELNDNSTSGDQTKLCESPISSNPATESLSTDETPPLSVLIDNSQNGNQTKRYESPISSKPVIESVSTSETSSSILSDNSTNGNQTKNCETPASKPTKESVFTRETSPLSVLNDKSKNGNQTKLCESPISSIPTTETLFTSEISPSSELNDNSTSGDQTKLCESPISSNPATESLSTDETPPLSVLIDNSQNGNQTKRYESPISSKPVIESVSTSETSSSILSDNSTNGNQTKNCETPASKPTKESVSTRETSPLSVLNDKSKNSNQAKRCESPISSKPMKQSVSTSEKSTSSTEISKNANQTKHCESLISSKPTQECLSTSQTSPSIVLNDNSTSGQQTKHCKSPTIFKPSKETTIKTPSTSETSTSSILNDNSKSSNLTKSPISSKSMKESVSSETSPSSTNNSKIGNPKKRKSLIISEPTKKSLSTGEKSPSNILNDDNKRGNETPLQTPELNLKKLSKTQKSPLKPNKMSLFSNDTPTGEIVSNSENSEQTSPRTQIATRSKSKFGDPCFVVLIKDPVKYSALETKQSECQKDKAKSDMPNQLASRKRRNNSSNEPEIQCKRILRSSTLYQRLSTENKEQSNATCNDNNILMEIPSANELKINKISNGNPMKPRKSNNNDTLISYDDLDLFSDDEKQPEQVSRQEKQPLKNINGFDPKQSILCCMIDKYGVENARKFANKKIPDAAVKTVCEKIEQYISNIIESSPAESKHLMTKFVADLQKLNHKHFIAGLMKYLTKPERKLELFSKVVSAPAPPMTKAEQILIYVILHLKTHWPSVDTVDAVLTNIEYTVFKLNRTPEFNIIESISHFYALLCRYFGAKSRLRLFILDAMYCIQFKSVPLIKQCLDVWMHIIPLAHMGIAKCPLVTCLVYLLHFYKCNDRFNRVQEIRNILSQKYFYKITDWNEAKILEMFRNSIKGLKDVPIERKMLRIALIILAKRHGPKWCQNQIIKNLLLPIIEKQNVPETVKEFCVSMIGPLMKPYPVDMKVNCEIVMNQLTEMLNKEPSQQMEEAIITSMIFINRHNQLSINKTLLSRKMKPLSPEFEGILREYVRAIPLKVWKKNISYLVHINKFN